jgi:hypothetical protein
MTRVAEYLVALCQKCHGGLAVPLEVGQEVDPDAQLCEICLDVMVLGRGDTTSGV